MLFGFFKIMVGMLSIHRQLSIFRELLEISGQVGRAFYVIELNRENVHRDKVLPLAPRMRRQDVQFFDLLNP